ncbi:MAG TPA: hypothetical protein PK325_07470 [Cyclobacteriaceae bacterium]|nr:hypothetical protein [Cyclobacteriaceae bacterium]HMV10439.1 hypothetical protein [Cyclobacteriaceae bacterium]HMX01362.1 hypothetical protein [Cyclobacteriaceae bacterium]HMX50367.1 hypothetical protein [Cyclobacteriaceae bacterium]HMY92436.1 hypothetical protein [Cyclobacteriaceae bacterium]
MKTICRTAVALIFLISPLVLTAQITATEPEYTNTIVYVHNNNETALLERQTPLSKVVSSPSLLLVGVGKTKTIDFVKGEKSPIRIPKSDTLNFIVSVKDNNDNPVDIVGVLKLEIDKKKHNRFVEVIMTDQLKGPEINEASKVSFQSVKYQHHSYLVTIVNLGPGEYMFTLRDGRLAAQMFGID